MKKIKEFILLILIFSVQNIYAEVIKLEPPKKLPPLLEEFLPKLEEKLPSEDLDGWKLEKNYTVMLESKLKVVVPLEIISDVEINAIVVDDEEIDVPFDIELNKKPDKQNFYKLKYSENIIDIDKDGIADTFIYSPKYINEKIVRDNSVKIKGKNISKDGEYSKKIYITIEVDE